MLLGPRPHRLDHLDAHHAPAQVQRAQLGRQRPVYTVMYGAASPMPVVVCYDPGADMCEMMIVDQRVEFDLTDALKAAGAAAAVLGK